MIRIALTLLLFFAAVACFAQPVTLPPSAKQLSKPGKLQDWVDTCIAAGETIELPAGRIEGNLVIKSDSVTLKGQGKPYRRRIAGTVIVPADPSKPAVTVRNACNVTLESFGVLDGFVSLEGSVGALTLHTTLKDVAVTGAKVGLQVSEPPGQRKNQHCAADVVVNHCTFTGCERGVELNHPQSVNVHVINQTYFYDCGTAIWINDGGRVVSVGSCCNGLGTWMRILKAGGNLVPCVMRDTYSDRTGGAAMPVIVDARGCADRVRVLVDAYSCPFLPADGPWYEVKHRHFYLPDGSKDAAANSVIKLADRDYFNAAGSLEGVTQ